MSGVGASRRGVLAAVLVLVVAGVCVRLGFWQLERLEQRRERNAALERGLELPPLELRGATLAALQRDPSRFVHRRARAYGAFQPDGEALLRGRSLGGRPGVQVLTPLLLTDGDAALLVNRGWLPSPDAATVDSVPRPARGARWIEGVLLPLPATRREDAHARVAEVEGERVLSLQRLNLPVLQERSSAPLLPVVLQQLPAPDPAGTPVRLPLPDLADEGPHLGYALQWFSFAAIAVVGLLLLVRRARRSGE